MSATPSPRLTARVRAMRRDRIFARLLEGQAAAAIAAEEGGGACGRFLSLEPNLAAAVGTDGGLSARQTDAATAGAKE